MPQLVGQHCVRCSEVIDNILDADFCPRCVQPVHHRCMEPEHPPAAHRCSSCGSAITPVADAAAPFVAELDQAPQEASSAAEDVLTAEVVPPAEVMRDFTRSLAKITPHVFVTWTLIGINVTVFLLMLGSGVSPVDPKIEELLKWGADFGPLTIGGQWWRLFTCMFVHIGIAHIAVNMWILAVAGPLVERMVGNVGFLVLYVVSGLIGSVTSLWWHPMLVSAGASGAIFGVLGALGALLLGHQGTVPAEALSHLWKGGLAFLGYNLVYGLFNERVDMACHIGGLGGGFVCGLVQRQPFTPAALTGRARRNYLTCGLGIIVVAGGIGGVFASARGEVRAQMEVQDFATMEQKTLTMVNDAAAKVQRQEMNVTEFVDLLEREALSPWRQQRQRFEALSSVPREMQHEIDARVKYMQLREDGWNLLMEAVRENNHQKSQQAGEKQKQADELAKKIKSGK